MRKTQSQLRAEQIAKLQAEQAAYDKRVKESVKTAAFARCAAVEELYEMLGVTPESPTTREGKNGTVQVSSDKDEAKRSVRLVEVVARLVAERDERTTVPPEHELANIGLGATPFASGHTMGQHAIQ